MSLFYVCVQILLLKLLVVNSKSTKTLHQDDLFCILRLANLNIREEHSTLLPFCFCHFFFAFAFIFKDLEQNDLVYRKNGKTFQVLRK